jgi:predicted RNA-binding protein Jag
MSKKGFFNFLKGWTSISEEEKQQRDYALAKLNEEKEEKEARRAAPAPQQQQAQQNSYQQTRFEVTSAMETCCVEKLEAILNLAQFSGHVRSKKKEGNRLFLEIYDSGDDAGRIIGKSGVTLEAIEMLLRHFVIRNFEVPIRITIDAGEYRNKRVSQARNKALRAAESVSHYGQRVALDPMSATERREVHMMFEHDNAVKTVSEGEGENRRIVLVKRDDDNASS